MNLEEAGKALKKYFGYESFRPMQADVIQSIYDNKDALVLMPTGGGKSICFQIPAVTLPGTCVVVSPLISLMKDQVEGLRANGISAAFLNSSLSLPEQQAVENDFFNNEIQLLYVSPEKLVSSSFLPLLKKASINLFAIDEAHCISNWGHDFRQEYTKLKFLKREFPNISIIALTATADKLTRQDIVSQLELKNPATYIASFDRPNLSLEVRPGQKRMAQILRFIQERPDQPGIIYCLSRKQTENLAEKLNDQGIKAEFYHAGLSERERSRVQESFINDQTPIITATIAFGMGIDKSNVRWIIHYNLPKNLEGYYQEIGRAGRDGVKADTLLFYSFADVMLLREILSKSEHEKQTELQLSKLERMQQYAETLHCRRRILLNYFGEDWNGKCGNCDICLNPPQFFDGTEIAQKALSAIYRLREQVGLNLLINVLRGSGRKDILEKGYHQIKTFGAGRNIPFTEWQQFLRQLLNLGYVEIAYDQNNVLKLTPASKRVLFEKEKVQLVKIATIKQRQEQETEKAKKVTQRQRVRDQLFEHLRQLRKQLAQEKGLPPYMIFSDATLEEMAAVRPLNTSAFRNISGVGEKKMEQYSQAFLEEIQNFVRSQEGNVKGATYLKTLTLYQQGKAPKVIAQEREISETTVINHLVRLYEDGHPVKIESFVTKEEIEIVVQSLKYLETPFQLKAIYEYHNEKISYPKIKFALAYHQKNKAN